jgi:2-keto-3-deoxy-L-fuconate dehydrogenase
MTGRLQGKHAVITQGNEFMGPVTAEIFRAEGARVTLDVRDVTAPGACEALIREAGHVDILIANLAGPNFSGRRVGELDDASWMQAFETMVHPLHRLVRAVLPQMQARKAGKIVVYGSAVALKGLKTLAAYSAARAAQVGYVQAVGVEVAPDNVQINLIAQNYVENPAYYPAELQAKPSFQASLSRQVPLGRLAKPEEDAKFAAFLASNDADFFVGQAIPFSGGWVQR